MCSACVVNKKKNKKGRAIKGCEFWDMEGREEPRDESMAPFCEVCGVPRRLCADEEMHRSGNAKDPAWCNVVQLARWAEECEQDARAGREAGARPLMTWKSGDGEEFDMAEGAGKQSAKVEGRALTVRFQTQREKRLWQEKAEKEEKEQTEEKARKKEKARDTVPLRLDGRDAPPVTRRVASCRSPDKVKRVDAKKK